MPHRHAVFDHRRLAPVVDVKHREVLHVRTLANAYGVDVPAQHRAEPDARMRSDGHVTNYVSPVRDVARRVYGGSLVEVTLDHDASGSRRVSQTRPRAKS